jgi:aspartate/methionine/tyrosine aminotransferase
MSPYIQAHFERSDDTWDAATNPDGYIGMCIAENKLVWDLLEPKLTAARQVPRTALEYDTMIGSDRFRRQLAEFLGRTLYRREVSAEHVAVLNGAGSVLELLFYAIADPGDGVLVPTPSYTGFWADLETRNELTIVPVHTSSADGFRLSTKQLEAVYSSTRRPIRALLFTSPSNPLGLVYSIAELQEVWAWAEAKGIHVVFDELFALSVFGPNTFASAASLRPSLGQRTHMVWAASKDLAASGLRCGVLVTENEDVMVAVDGLAYWASVSGDTQHLIGEMVSDADWIDGFVAENRRRLGHAYSNITASLDDAGIRYLAAEAGFFFLIDVRAFLESVTWEAEDALWRRLLEEANVNLSPGSACRIGEPGFMRVVFPCVAPEAAATGVARMARVLGATA